MWQKRWGCQEITGAVIGDKAELDGDERVQRKEKITPLGGKAKDFRESDLRVILWPKESSFIPQACSEHP